ncbi:hypothetical protein [Actinoplanes regularis]|uniref:hypothetical protein n=1 Tax=Actinoplanes regularis TaxID=52697 RepID=UPI0024A5E9C4|nr:hypothetical protein [Actinoplanes regularis]GLW32354.1 hypothetical protein Areg01_52930 [Actinoplanes regularis]
MPKRPTPPIVTAMCILLYLGGGLTVFYSLAGSRVHGGPLANALPLFGQTLYGVFILVLAFCLQRAHRWAWWSVLVANILSLMLGALSVGLGGLDNVGSAVIPVIYLILLTRPAVRGWFFEPRPSPPLPETL